MNIDEEIDREPFESLQRVAQRFREIELATRARKSRRDDFQKNLGFRAAKGLTPAQVLERLAPTHGSLQETIRALIWAGATQVEIMALLNTVQGCVSREFIKLRSLCLENDELRAEAPVSLWYSRSEGQRNRWAKHRRARSALE